MVQAITGVLQGYPIGKTRPTVVSARLFYILLRNDYGKLNSKNLFGSFSDE